MPSGPSGVLPRLRPRWTILTFWAIDPADLAPDGTRPRVDEIWWMPGDDENGEAALVIAAATGLSAGDVAQRLARGAHCLGLRRDYELASTGWVSTRSAWVGEIGCWLTPSRGEAYVWDFWTQPRFRGNGLYLALLRESVHRLGEAGIERIWIGAEWQNWRSILGIAHAGFRPIGAVVAVRFVGLGFRYLIANPDVADPIARSLRDALRAQPSFGDRLDGRRGAAVAQERRDSPQTQDAQWLECPSTRRRFFAAHDASLERPRGGPVDADQGQAA